MNIFRRKAVKQARHMVWRTHKAIPGSRLHVVKRGAHGFNLSHAGDFNKVLLDFLEN